MEEQLNRQVKEVISDYPEVGTILADYDVGCTNCTLGSCLLKDVVDIHNLPLDTQVEMMQRIEGAIFPARKQKSTYKPKATKPATKSLSYSPPVEKLVNEHKLIKRWIRLLPVVINHIDNDPDTAWKWIEQGIDFSRNYADKYHHAKEEDILFAYTETQADIVQVMLDDHRAGRNHIKQAVQAVENRDEKLASYHLLAYRELLEEHIKKEDEILFPWIDRKLNTRQVGELFSKFGEVDAQVADSFSAKYQEFVEQVEQSLKQ